MKKKRYNFVFKEEINQLLVEIQRATEWTLTNIVEKGIQAIAKEKGLK